MKIGTLVGGRYRVLRELGRGGMGVVYEAIDEALQRPVALKVLLGSRVDGEHYERFIREARAAASVNNPHIVQVLDFNAGPPPFLVMEMLQGVTLTERLRGGLLTELEAVELARQVLAALELVHDRGIVHRDIKASNLFAVGARDARAHWKVVDFGIAKLAHASRVLTEEGSVLGTLPYIPPDVLLGEGTADASGDLYALGVCMYEALVGRRPTVQTDIRAILDEIRQPPPSIRVFSPQMSLALSELVDRAVARDPSRRFRSAREMRDALNGLTTLAAPAMVSNQPVALAAPVTSARYPPVPPSWHTATVAPKSSHPNPIWIVAGVLVFIFFGVVAVLPVVISRLANATTDGASSKKSGGPSFSFGSSQRNYFKDATSLSKLYSEKVGDAPRAIELLIYPTYGYAQFQDPKVHQNVDQYDERDGTVEDGKPVTRPANGDPDEVDAAAFDFGSIDFTLVPKVVEDAPAQTSIADGQVTHVMVKRNLPFSKSVTFFVFVSGARKNAVVQYDVHGQKPRVLE